MKDAPNLKDAFKLTGRRAVAAAAYARAVWVVAVTPGPNRHDRRFYSLVARTHKKQYRKLVANALRGLGDFVKRVEE